MVRLGMGASGGCERGLRLTGIAVGVWRSELRYCSRWGCNLSVYRKVVLAFSTQLRHLPYLWTKVKGEGQWYENFGLCLDF
jgi:hypothetical protein